MYVFDQGNALSEQLEKFSHEFDTHVSGVAGRGEFVGADTRASARRVYDGIINQWEAEPTHARYQPRSGRVSILSGTAANKDQNDGILKHAE